MLIIKIIKTETHGGNDWVMRAVYSFLKFEKKTREITWMEFEFFKNKL